MTSDERERGARAGIVAMILATLSFTIMISLAKVVMRELTTLDVVFWRGCITVGPLFLMARSGGLRIGRWRIMILRCLCGFGAIVLFFYAAQGLLVSNLYFVGRTQSLFVALLAPLIIGSQEGQIRRLWLPSLVTLLGCFLIFTPDLRRLDLYALVAVAGTVFSAGGHLNVRLLSPYESRNAIVFWFQLAMTVLAAIGLLCSGQGAPGLPSPELIPHLIGTGLAGTAGQLLMTRAYAKTRAPVIAFAGYSGILWAMGFDLFLFELFPGPQALVGGTLIVLAAFQVARSAAPEPVAQRLP